MGTAFEPDGTNLRVGVWGTDCDFEPSASALSSDGYWEFKATTPAADPELEYSDFIPVTEGDPYSHFAWVYASSIAGGNTVRVATEWYTNAKVLISTSDNYNAVLPAINTWYEVGSIEDAPANARYAKIFVGKNNTAFTVRLDRFDLRPFPHAAHSYRNANQAAMANGDVIEFNVERYDHGSNMDVAATWDFTFPTTGVYAINAQAFIDDLDADEIAFLTLAHTANAWAAQSTMGYGSYTTSRAANSQPPCILAYAGKFNRGEAVRIRLWHTHAAAATVIGGGNNETSFSVSRVE